MSLSSPEGFLLSVRSRCGPGTGFATRCRKLAAAAITAHNVLGLRDLSRTDLIVSGDQVFFLEVNVAPGMTETSTLPMALQAAGLDLGVACRDLLCLAAARGS